MKRKIYEWPSSCLSKKAALISKEELEAAKKIEIDLIDTCNINMGVGLAATQIGISKRIVVIKPSAFGVSDFAPSKYNEEYLTLINPELSCSESKIKWVEACLSLPMTSGGVERFDSCDVTYLDSDGEKQSFTAKWPFAGGIQHECDHLDGYTFNKRMNRMSASLLIKKYQKIRKKKQRELRKSFKR